MKLAVVPVSSANCLNDTRRAVLKNLMREPTAESRPASSEATTWTLSFEIVEPGIQPPIHLTVY